MNHIKNHDFNISHIKNQDFNINPKSLIQQSK